MYMNNKPIGKTPYEIRLELLQLAQVILNEKHKADAASELASVGVFVSTQAKTSPTTEEIIAEAEKMNRFISNGNTL
jgi:hypothetical protein